MKLSHRFLASISVVFSCIVPAWADGGADTIYVNGRVYTVNERLPWVESFAVSGDRIVAVGESERMHRLAGKNTRVVDLEGRMVLPGIIDDHIHPDMAAEHYANVNLNAETADYDDFREIRF